MSWFIDEETKQRSKPFAHSHTMLEVAAKTMHSAATLKYFSNDGC